MMSLKENLREAAESFPNLSKVYDIYLVSEKFGMHTRVDCILIDKPKKQAWPLQVKWAKKPKKIYRSHLLQLLFEALLIEEQLGYNVNGGFIRFLKGNETVKIEITDKSILFKSLENIDNIIKGEKFPKPTEFKKRCVDCCYRRKCWSE